MWDYEKNGELKPENITAGSTSQYIWLKCPVDGHSWKKKPNDITTSWTRSGTSGCPMCAGKTKKPEKQSNLNHDLTQYNQMRSHLIDDNTCLKMILRQLGDRYDGSLK